MAVRARRTAPRAEALERILEVTRRLAGPFELRPLLGEVIEAALALLEAERGSVFLYDASRNELVSSVATGEGELRIPADRGIVGEAAQTRTLITVPDAYADPRFNPEVDRKTGYRTRNLLTVPLVGEEDALVGVLQVLNKKTGAFTDEDERIATALAAQCAVALQRVRMLFERVAKERMEKELAVAREIQMRCLPAVAPQVDGYRVAGASRPAEETGGDVYDVVPAGHGRLMLLVGDATGHGVGPALSVTQVRAMLRIGLRLGAGLDDVYTHVNEQLAEDLASNRFVTAFLGLLDASGHAVHWHSGGQGPILVARADGTVERHKPTTFPMGMMGGIPLKPSKRFDLAPGDLLAVMTDGIFEAENPEAEQFGVERVESLLSSRRETAPDDLVAILFDAVDTFARGVPPADDRTVLLVKRVG